MADSRVGSWDVAGAVREAEERIRPLVRETPVERSLRFEQMIGRRVFVKLENLQHTGSFKARGALNALLALGRRARSGVVAASTGNHGAAVAFAGARLGLPVTIWVPEGTASTKLDAIRRLGAEIEFHGSDGVESEMRARSEAERVGLPYVSPYNDRAVVGGQGTVGLEIDRQLDDFDAVFVAVGGGGLISGLGGYLAEARPDVQIIGCSPEASPVMDASVRAGRILELPCDPTLSDGTAGGVERGAITFETCRLLVDQWIRVPEDQIAAAMVEFIESHHQLAEGAAGVALAGLLAAAERHEFERAVVVVCGGNLSLAALRDLPVARSR